MEDLFIYLVFFIFYFFYRSSKSGHYFRSMNYFGKLDGLLEGLQGSGERERKKEERLLNCVTLLNDPLRLGSGYVM